MGLQISKQLELSCNSHPKVRLTLPDLIHDFNYKDISVFQIYLFQAFAVFSSIFFEKEYIGAKSNEEHQQAVANVVSSKCKFPNFGKTHP